MKTVQDYLDLGLVFVKGDFTIESDGSSNRGDSSFDVDFYFNQESAFDNSEVESFAWRNNDGVNPEYKGLIHAMFENGAIIKDFADSFNWGSSFNPVIQWRPVVLQSESPTVSSKEDKPMKPVYTAEMKAKGELPPVGSDFMYSRGGDFQRGIMLFNDGITLLVCLADSKANRWHWKCEDKDLVFKPIIKTIKVNGFDVPAPMSEAPMIDDGYFTPQTGYEVFYCANKWRSDGYDHRFLSRGLVHSTKSAAIAHAKAMLGIDPNA